jgi:hypothetical protein
MRNPRRVFLRMASMVSIVVSSVADAFFSQGYSLAAELATEQPGITGLIYRQVVITLRTFHLMPTCGIPFFTCSVSVVIFYNLSGFIHNLHAWLRLLHSGDGRRVSTVGT